MSSDGQIISLATKACIIRAQAIDCLQGCEQKVGSLIVKLDCLRCTVAEPSLAQVVDIVQEISEARTPEPSGSNSNYSVLFVRS